MRVASMEFACMNADLTCAVQISQHWWTAHRKTTIRPTDGKVGLSFCSSPERTSLCLKPWMVTRAFAFFPSLFGFHVCKNIKNFAGMTSPSPAFVSGTGRQNRKTSRNVGLIHLTCCSLKLLKELFICFFLIVLLIAAFIPIVMPFIFKPSFLIFIFLIDSLIFASSGKIFWVRLVISTKHPQQWSGHLVVVQLSTVHRT